MLLMMLRIGKKNFTIDVKNLHFEKEIFVLLQPFIKRTVL